eukprot:2535707-Prymnesium_polylepis.2
MYDWVSDPATIPKGKNPWGSSRVKLFRSSRVRNAEENHTRCALRSPRRSVSRNAQTACGSPQAPIVRKHVRRAAAWPSEAPPRGGSLQEVELVLFCRPAARVLCAKELDAIASDLR